MSNIFFHLQSGTSCRAQQQPPDASLLKRQGNPHFSVTGSGNFAAGPRIQSPDGAKTSIKTSFSSTGVGKSCITSQVTLLLKDGQQDFFMSVGKWEMANGQWHIGQ